MSRFSRRMLSRRSFMAGSMILCRRLPSRVRPMRLHLQSGSFALLPRRARARSSAHLHRHTFRVLSRNGLPTRHREWQDTVLVRPRETVEIAFVADNPGDWMFHCHVLEHQAGGMIGTIRVA